MSIVMPVRRVVNCVVASSHYPKDIAMKAVVNVCGPDGLKKEKDFVREEVHWQHKQCKHMRTRLNDPIDGVKRQTCAAVKRPPI